MAVELPNNTLNTHISMMANPCGIHFASLHNSKTHSKNGKHVLKQNDHADSQMA